MLAKLGSAWGPSGGHPSYAMANRGMMRGQKKIKDLGREELTVKNFILTHAIRVPIATESNNDQTFLLRHDGLVDVPAGDKMGENDGTHFEDS